MVAHDRQRTIPVIGSGDHRHTNALMSMKPPQTDTQPCTEAASTHLEARPPDLHADTDVPMPIVNAVHQALHEHPTTVRYVRLWMDQRGRAMLDATFTKRPVYHPDGGISGWMPAHWARQTFIKELRNIVPTRVDIEGVRENRFRFYNIDIVNTRLQELEEENEETDRIAGSRAWR